MKLTKPKLALLGCAFLGYMNQRTYEYGVGIKRSLLALFFEGRIFINYKLVSYDNYSILYLHTTIYTRMDSQKILMNIVLKN
jgi:hypothetical protein